LGFVAGPGGAWLAQTGIRDAKKAAKTSEEEAKKKAA